MTYSQWIRGELFSPVNMFIIILNSLFFIGVLVIFFWFILSTQFESIMLDKVDIVTLFAQNDPAVYSSIKEYIDKVDVDQLKATSDSDQNARNTSNTQLFVDNLVWWFAVLGILTLVSFGYLISHGLGNITIGEYMLIFLIILSFTTEIVFYFAMVNSWKFIGDFQLLKNLLPNIQ